MTTSRRCARSAAAAALALTGAVGAGLTATATDTMPGAAHGAPEWQEPAGRASFAAPAPRSSTPVLLRLAGSPGRAGFAFDAQAGRLLSLAVTDVAIAGAAGAVTVTLRSPGGRIQYLGLVTADGGMVTTFPRALPESGRYRVSVSAGTGSGTLTLHRSVWTPPRATPLALGRPAAGAVTNLQRPALFRVDLLAGADIAWNLHAAGLTAVAGATALTVEAWPAGHPDQPHRVIRLGDSTGMLHAEVGGTWLVAVRPYGATVGPFTLTGIPAP